MIKQISKFYRFQVQIYQEQRQARKAHNEDLLLIDTDFYTFLLKQPGIREAISKIHIDAATTSFNNHRHTRLPKYSKLLVQLYEKTKDTDDMHYAINDFFRSTTVATKFKRTFLVGSLLMIIACLNIFPHPIPLLLLLCGGVVFYLPYMMKSFSD